MTDRAATRWERTRLAERLREWWWTVLPLVVLLSIGVSSIAGGHAPRVEPSRVPAVLQAPSGIFQTVVPLDAGHRLAVGHHRRHPFDFDACVAARSDVTPRRQAQRYCLALAHLDISTPFS